MTVTLRPTTLTILKALQRKDGVDAQDLARELGMDYIVVMSGVNELSEHGLAHFKEENVREYTLTAEGKNYAENGLPEQNLFKLLVDRGIKEIELEKLQKIAGDELGIEKKIFFIALNHLKRSSWISQTRINNETRIIVLKQEYEDREESRLLNVLNGKEKVLDGEIPSELARLVPVLKKRKLVNEKRYTRRTLHLTKEGKKLDPATVVVAREASRLTPEMLRDGSWRQVTLKAYDVTKPGPRLHPGKINPLVEIINKVREIFYSMGFMEIRGPIVESAFFNFDALFQPQDHPAREMHDTFYLAVPEKARLPEKKYVENVRAAHENGGDTGSTGWGYKWDIEVARQTLLRTHTTATTVRQLGKAIEEGAKLPLKVFSVDRVYRNEKVDFSHLAEFMQVEGIIIGENVTLSDLRGTLVEFYKKMGFQKVITRPGFFPYTEPSMEISVFSEELGKWMEIGGSGIFRPEVCAPWGIKEPVRVLAWGQGLERIAMLRLGRKDIRDLYRNPISWLRRAPYPRK